MKTCTLDVEANGFLEDATVVHCAVVKDNDTGEKFLFDPKNIHELPAFLGKYQTIRGHNLIAYDLPLLHKLLGFEHKGNVVDTLLMSRTQRPDRSYPIGCPRKVGPHSVEAYGYRFKLPKKEHEDWSVFSPEMLERCATDVDIQDMIYNFLMNEGKDEGWEQAHRLNAQLFRYLQKQEAYGWLVDKELIIKNLATLDRYIGMIDRACASYLPLLCEPEEIKKDGEFSFVRKPFTQTGALVSRVREWFDGVLVDGYAGECFHSGNAPSIAGPFSRCHFRPVDLNSNSETKEFLLVSGWEPTEWNSNKDGQRTSPKFGKDDEFVGINSGLGRLIARRVQCRQRKGILDGWLSSIRSDNRITPRVSGIATTGRLRHAGIVNVPSIDAKAFFARRMRSVFIARPGWVLVGTDSASNQMRQLAGRLHQVSDGGDREFEYAILSGQKEAGTDLHSLNQKRSGVDTRTKAKNFFYGCILFGAGLAKTAKIIGGSKEEAQRLKDEFFQEMPLLQQFLDQEIVAWRKTAQKVYNSKFGRMEYRNGYIRGLDGRPVAVEFEKDILVYYLQSDEAIQMAAAYCRTVQQLSKRGYVWGDDYGIVIWYHDEIDIECKPELAEEVGQITAEAIAWAGRYYGIKCPHAGDYKIGRNWAEIH